MLFIYINEPKEKNNKSTLVDDVTELGNFYTIGQQIVLVAFYNCHCEWCNILSNTILCLSHNVIFENLLRIYSYKG